MAAAGAGSAITGMRADVLVSDDLVSGQEQADSMGQLDKLWEWYLSDARTRLKPGGREVMIMTRWARRDPAGRILDLIESGDEDWTIIRLPMEAEEADPLGREYGDPLWPEWFTPMQVREAKRDPRRWSCLYQQRPLDESGAWVPSSAIEIVPKAPKVGPVVIGVDLALSVGKGDWSAMVACALDEQRNLIVLEVWRDRCAVQDLVERLFEWFDRWKPQIVDLDDDNASKVFRDLVRERGVLRGRAVPVRLVPMRGRDKETRAAPLRGAFLSDRVKIVTGRHDSDLRDEILSFPSGLHDDMIDALGLCARELVSKPAPRPPEEPRDTIKPRVVEKDGGLFLNHGLEDMWPDARGSDRI
jgi:predicted phage terminase large subunit-like protein